MEWGEQYVGLRDCSRMAFPQEGALSKKASSRYLATFARVPLTSLADGESPVSYQSTRSGVFLTRNSSSPDKESS